MGRKQEAVVFHSNGVTEGTPRDDHEAIRRQRRRIRPRGQRGLVFLAAVSSFRRLPWLRSLASRVSNPCDGPMASFYCHNGAKNAGWWHNHPGPLSGKSSATSCAENSCHGRGNLHEFQRKVSIVFIPPAKPLLACPILPSARRPLPPPRWFLSRRPRLWLRSRIRLPRNRAVDFCLKTVAPDIEPNLALAPD